MRALILCAGLGERLRPLTLQRAKPAIEFLNLPMLAFPYYWLKTVGLSDIIFNTHYLPDSLRQAATRVVDPNIQMHFTQEDIILGSGGGIWNARSHLQADDDFALANGDGVITCAEIDLMESMLRFHRRKNALATLLVCPLEGVGTRIPGVWLDSYDEVVNFGKASRRNDLHCRHYASFMFLSKRVWKYLPEGASNILYDVLDAAIAQGEKVYGFDVAPDRLRWFETGNAAEYLSATRECLELLQAGDRLGTGLQRLLDEIGPAYKQNSDWSRLRLVADSATLSPAAIIEGFCVIGAEAQVDAGTRFSDCVVLPGAKVPAGAIKIGEIVT